MPGPTMSFNESLGMGIFEFEFKTFVEHAVMLYQDDEGNADYIRCVRNSDMVSEFFLFKQPLVFEKIRNILRDVEMYTLLNAFYLGKRLPLPLFN